MNTKFVLGLPQTKQVGLEHAKNLKRCERWLADPPPLGISKLTDSMFFFYAFLICYGNVILSIGKGLKGGSMIPV